MAEPLIELKGVSKSFGETVVLDKVDLTICRGEALAIIGPSGTGKSTILRIAAGLLAPDAGEVYVRGQRREGLVEDGDEPIGIGMVFQNAALFDSLNGGGKRWIFLVSAIAIVASTDSGFSGEEVGDGWVARRERSLSR